MIRAPSLDRAKLCWAASKKAAYQLQRDKITSRRSRLLNGLLAQSQGGNRSKWTTFCYKRVTPAKVHTPCGKEIIKVIVECPSVLTIRFKNCKVCFRIQQETMKERQAVPVRRRTCPSWSHKSPGTRESRPWENYTYKACHDVKQQNPWATKTSKALQTAVMITPVTTSYTPQWEEVSRSPLRS